MSNWRDPHAIYSLLQELDGSFDDCNGIFVSVRNNGVQVDIELDYGDGKKPDTYAIVPLKL